MMLILMMMMMMVMMMAMMITMTANDQVWLQCRMGLCSATNAGAGGNILR